MSAKELGTKIGVLRHEIFKAGLLPGGFLDKKQEKGFQDAGQFFELILHLIGRGFQLEISKTPIAFECDLEDKTKVELIPQGVFYLQNLGDSIQEVIDSYRDAKIETLDKDNEWMVDGNTMSKFKETQKIIGEAPEILVVRVNEHIVNPEDDKVINFAPLFKKQPEHSNYELVGFAQNHQQVHWTSVVNNEGKWNYCNDANVKEIETSDDFFKHPANYMVFKKIP